jgi:hypothetical protein
MSNKDTTPQPLIELFRTKTRRALVRLAIEDSETRWFTKADLARKTTPSRESIRKELTTEQQEIPPLVAFSVYEINAPDARITRYRPSDSSVVRLLRDANDDLDLDLVDFFQSEGRRNLSDWFLFESDRDVSYSMNQIQESGMHYETVSEHITQLVDSKIVTPTEGVRATNFHVRENSETTRFLYTLNAALWDAMGENPMEEPD